MYAIFRKELADHLSSKRFVILFSLVLLSAVFAIYIAIQTIRSVVGPTSEFIFLKVFTTSGGNLPSFLFFLSLFIPIVGIALGFDAVNNERNTGNLSRLVSQPIYRDSIINGKFLAGLAVLSIMIVGVVAIVAGLGIRIVGVPPSGEEWRVCWRSSPSASSTPASGLRCRPVLSLLSQDGYVDAGIACCVDRVLLLRRRHRRRGGQCRHSRGCELDTRCVCAQRQRCREPSRASLPVRSTARRLSGC